MLFRQSSHAMLRPFFPPLAPSGLTSTSRLAAIVELPMTADWNLAELSNRSKSTRCPLFWYPDCDAIAAKEFKADTASWAREDGVLTPEPGVKALTAACPLSMRSPGSSLCRHRMRRLRQASHATRLGPRPDVRWTVRGLGVAISLRLVSGAILNGAGVALPSDCA